MSEVRVQIPRKRVTDRGVTESLGSLNANAEKHSNLYDGFNNFFGKGIDDIDYSTRELDGDGRVKVTKYDILMGRSQPELQLEYEKWRRGQVNNSDAGHEHYDLYGTTPLSVDTSDWTPNRGSKRINEGSLVRSNSAEQTRRTDTKLLLDELSKIEVNGEGTALKASLLQQLKSNPKVTTDQISDAIAKVTKYNPTVIQDRNQGEANLNLTNQKITSAQNADSLALRTEINNHRIQEAEIAYKNSVNEYNWKNAEADRDYKWRAAEADREQKKVLTMLGYEDKRDARAADREDRRAENRQLMILQLMKGLGNLGGAMAL